MKKLFLFFIILSSSFIQVFSNNSPRLATRQYFEIKIYHAGNNEQVNQLKNYLRQALIPALHRYGLKSIGVFEAIANDTATDKKIYVFIPYASFQDIEKVSKKLNLDKTYQQAGVNFLNAAHDKAPVKRTESIILYAFELMPRSGMPSLKGNIADRVYELRSYESATENLYRNKVKMFNEGGEIALFKRLGFNAVFYGEVMAGSKMPNLMYMTSFDNMQSRNDHWKTFVDDPEWKKLSAMAEYKNNVSHIDIYLLRPLEFSDI